MKIMKCLLALAVVFCFGISLFLTSFTVGFAATITPNPVSQGTKLITIKAGDTLWFLAGVYLKDPMLWGQFKQYNHFTDPNLIFPGEKLLVPTTSPAMMSGMCAGELRDGAADGGPATVQPMEGPRSAPEQM